MLRSIGNRGVALSWAGSAKSEGPRLQGPRSSVCMFCLCFLLYNYFLRFRSDQLSQNLMDRYSPGVGRTLAVDDKTEISFPIPQGTFPCQPHFVGFSAWMSMDAGG